MKRVLHVLTVPVSLRFLTGQPAYMRGRGYELAVACAEGPMLSTFAEANGVRGFSFGIERAVAPRADVQAIRELVRIIRSFKPDIVHGHTPKGGLIAMIAATITGCPSRLYHLRGLPLATAKGVNALLLGAAEVSTCGMSRKVISVSESLKGDVVARGLVREAKVRVLVQGSGNGVDSQRFSPSTTARLRHAARDRFGVPQDTTLFLFVGRLTKDKGIAELLEAWTGMGQRNAHLLVVGELDSREPLDSATLGGLEGVGVVWAPFAEDIEYAYAAADVVVLPTYREGFPNVALEAAACGLPIVATEVVGCVDAVVHDQTGILVPPQDANGLQLALQRYLDLPALRRTHGACARERVETYFLPELIHSAIADVYDELLIAKGD